MSANDNAPEQAREVVLDAHEWRGGYFCSCGHELNSPWGFNRHLVEALEPTLAAERQEAAREVTEAWCDWLAAICFGIDFSTALPPPCSATDLAEAMHREDPSESADIWALCVEDNTGQRFGPYRADGVTGRSGT